MCPLRQVDISGTSRLQSGDHSAVGRSGQWRAPPGSGRRR